MGKGLPPTSFSPGVSTNVKISPKKLVSTLLPHLRKIKRLYLLSEQLLNLNQEHTSKKKMVFLFKSLWNWAYDNFSLRVTKPRSLQYNLTHVIKSCCDIIKKIITNYYEDQGDLQQQIWLTSWKLLPCLLKEILKTQQSWKN